MDDLFGDGSHATLSDCLTFRYRLERRTSASGTRVLGVVMVNPSTADAREDDPTIRKVRGFATRLGYSRFVVANLFAFRATNVRDLGNALDPIGPDNDAHIEAVLRECDEVLAAWGPLAKLPRELRRRWLAVGAMAQDVGKPLLCLGTALDGQPRHPLMLSYETPVEEWRAPAPP